MRNSAPVAESGEHERNSLSPCDGDFPHVRKPRNLPDLKFIRDEVPILDVARKLGIKIAGRNVAHCWRIEHHKNGDRTPSLSFHKNHARCFVCDTRSLSTLDLVAAHENYSTLNEAVSWILAGWQIPAIPANTKLRRPQRWQSGRVGIAAFPLERIVRTGFWASLDDACRAVLVALLCFLDPTSGEATISHRGLARYSGKASRTTITHALSRFENAGLIKVHRRSDGATRKVSTYQMTLESDRFQRLLTQVHERTIAERDLEISTLPARLPKSRPMSTVLYRSANERSALVNRSDENVPKMQSKRSTTVYRSLASDLNYPANWDEILRNPDGEPGEDWQVA